MLKRSAQPWYVHLRLLIFWILVGGGLRLLNLTGKPPWTDEFATLVFSLGHSFKTVPLNQAISLDALMQPLRWESEWQGGAVLKHLLTEDVHPPLYFLLANAWNLLFEPVKHLGTSWVSLWGARSLAALFGTLTIPAVFGLGTLAFRSVWVGQFAAAMMAVSPYGLYLSQEARHYTLGMLWVTASLACLVVAFRGLKQRQPIPIWLMGLWVVINALGMATHYFFLLTLGAEAILLGLFWWSDRPVPTFAVRVMRIAWNRLYLVGAGTLLGALVWLPFLLPIYTSDMTQWIHSGDRWSFLSLINPIFQSLAAWITMVVLLPVESPFLTGVILSGLAMLMFLIWAVPILLRGFRKQAMVPERRWSLQGLGGFVLGAIALFFLITYVLGTDITRGARYSFVYFPAVMVLVGSSLAAIWTTPAPNAATPGNSRFTPQQQVLIILCVGLLSGLTVVSNLGYRKYYRPDLLVNVMQAQASTPTTTTLIATSYQTLVQTGEMMGIGWEWQSRLAKSQSRTFRNSPQFLLDVYHCPKPEATSCQERRLTLQQTLGRLPRPLDVWLVNFFEEKEKPQSEERDKTELVLQTQGCHRDINVEGGVNGYGYALYRCKV